MANGKGKKALARKAQRALRRAAEAPIRAAGAGASGLIEGHGRARKATLKKLLGMTKRPTTAGQARFGDVDVTGAQTTAREQGRLAGAGLRGLVGAQMTPIEAARQTAMGIKNPGVIGKAIQRKLGAQMTEAERRRLKGGR